MTESTWRTRPVTTEDAREFASWHYEEPYSMYDAAPEDADRYLDPAYDYVAVVDGSDGLVGYCCFGPDACVPGGSYGDEAIDIGAGMRPSLTGRGLGSELLAAALAEACRRSPGRPQRVTIAAFNERAQRLVWRAGFAEVERFRSESGREFVVLVRS
jgi:RimJ/RimL family protein N-acetyltransferase